MSPVRRQEVSALPMSRNVPKCVRIVCAAYRKFASSPVAHPLDADAIPSPLSAHFVCILSANMRFRFQTLQVQHVHKETTRSRSRSRSRRRGGSTDCLSDFLHTRWFSQLGRQPVPISKCRPLVRPRPPVNISFDLSTA